MILLWTSLAIAVLSAVLVCLLLRSTTKKSLIIGRADIKKVLIIVGAALLGISAFSVYHSESDLLSYLILALMYTGLFGITGLVMLVLQLVKEDQR